MSIWQNTRNYTHDYPALSGPMLKRLLSLSPAQSLRWQSYRGKLLEVHRLSASGDMPRFYVRLNDGNAIFTLESTRTAFNGLRWWFTCSHCLRRCGARYWTHNAIACRQCLNLHYQSQSEAPRERELRRVRKMRQAIWGEDEPDVNNLFRRPDSFPKPKGMHRRIFEEKCNQLTLKENQYLCGLLAVLERRYWGSI